MGRGHSSCDFSIAVRIGAFAGGTCMCCTGVPASVLPFWVCGCSSKLLPFSSDQGIPGTHGSASVAEETELLLLQVLGAGRPIPAGTFTCSAAIE